MSDLRKLEKLIKKTDWLKEWKTEKQAHSFIQVCPIEKFVDHHVYGEKELSAKRGVYVISLNGEYVYVGQSKDSSYYRIKCFITRIRRAFGEVNPKTGKPLSSSDSDGDRIVECINEISSSSTAMLKVEWIDLSDYTRSVVSILEDELILVLKSKLNKENMHTKKSKTQKLKLVEKAA